MTEGQPKRRDIKEVLLGDRTVQIISGVIAITGAGVGMAIPLTREMHEISDYLLSTGSMAVSGTSAFVWGMKTAQIHRQKNK